MSREHSPSVVLIQADTRLTDADGGHLQITMPVNKKVCKHLNYEYRFVHIDEKLISCCVRSDKLDNKNRNRKDRYAKIFLIDSILKETDADVLVFLDSDAWVQNCNYLNQLICKLVDEKTKIGCFSRDPYCQKNTYVNSGSFILKVNDSTRKMYDIIKYNYYNFPKTGIFKRFNDQYYISNYVYENKEDYYIFEPTILNSPVGKILRHNWWKDQRINDDTKLLMNEDFENQSNYLNLDKYLDNKPWPNKNKSSEQWRLKKSKSLWKN